MLKWCSSQGSKPGAHPCHHVCEVVHLIMVPIMERVGLRKKAVDKSIAPSSHLMMHNDTCLGCNAPFHPSDPTPWCITMVDEPTGTFVQEGSIDGMPRNWTPDATLLQVTGGRSLGTPPRLGYLQPTRIVIRVATLCKPISTTDKNFHLVPSPRTDYTHQEDQVTSRASD